MTVFIFDGWYWVAQWRWCPEKGKDLALPFETCALRYSPEALTGTCEAEDKILKLNGLGEGKWQKKKLIFIKKFNE